MRVALLTSAAFLAGCVQSDRTYFGTVQRAPSNTGEFTQVAASDTAVFSDGSGNGYALAYAQVDAQTYNMAGASPDDTAYLAIVGMLPATNVGATPTSGTATMTGTYNVLFVERPNSDVASWVDQTTSSAVSIVFDFNPDVSNGTDGSFTGSSTDGLLTVSGEFYGLSTHSMDVTYDGVTGYGDIVVGATDAVGIFDGEDDTMFFVGGFIVTD